MYVAVKCRPEIAPRIARCSTIARSRTDGEIRDFLAGKTDGEDLLHAIYDDVLDEPIPDRLLAVLRG